LDLEQASVAGVPGRASRIDLDFVSPGGARTGKLLPAGNPSDTIEITYSSLPRISVISCLSLTSLPSTSPPRPSSTFSNAFANRAPNPCL